MCVAVDKAFSKLILPRLDAQPHLSQPQQQKCSQKKLIMRVVDTLGAKPQKWAGMVDGVLRRGLGLGAW